MIGLETEIKFFNKLKDPRDAAINVGWFEDQQYYNGISVARVARWNEFGTRQGIPERPFVRTCIMENERKWVETLKTLVQKALDENKSVESAMRLFGELVRGDLQETILAGGWKPNSKLTIYGGWARNKISGKPFYTPGKGTGKQPLVNTGTMLKSIDVRTDEEMGDV